MTRFVLAACSAALLGIGAAPSAFGAEQGWYIGTGIGYGKASLDDGSIRGEVARQSPGSTAVGPIDKDEDTFLYKLFLGYSFTSMIALEANAFMLPDLHFGTNVSPAGRMSGETDYWGFSLDVLAFLPLGGNWRIYGRAGGLVAETRVELKGQGMALADDELLEYEPGYKFGAGVAYEFDSGVAFRGEWERYVLDDAMGGDTDVDAFSITFLYRFK
ncbi:MAG TPA: porin family protein [Burkholderiales bacterium]|jgi:OOP family OmpA-OmpF porin